MKWWNAPITKIGSRFPKTHSSLSWLAHGCWLWMSLNTEGRERRERVRTPRLEVAVHWATELTHEACLGQWQEEMSAAPHYPDRNLSNLYRGLPGQLSDPSRWSRQHLLLSRLCPWNGWLMGTAGGPYIPRTGEAWAAFHCLGPALGQPVIMSSW